MLYPGSANLLIGEFLKSLLSIFGVNVDQPAKLRI